MDNPLAIPSTSSEEEQICNKDVVPEGTSSSVDLLCSEKIPEADTSERDLLKSDKCLSKSGSDWTEVGDKTGSFESLPSGSTSGPVVTSSEGEHGKLKVEDLTVEKTSESTWFGGGYVSVAESTGTSVGLNVTNLPSYTQGGHESPQTRHEIDDTNVESSSLKEIESDDSLPIKQKQIRNKGRKKTPNLSIVSSGSDTSGPAISQLTGKQHVGAMKTPKVYPREFILEVLSLATAQSIELAAIMYDVPETTIREWYFGIPESSKTSTPRLPSPPKKARKKPSSPRKILPKITISTAEFPLESSVLLSPTTPTEHDRSQFILQTSNTDDANKAIAVINTPPGVVNILLVPDRTPTEYSLFQLSVDTSQEPSTSTGENAPGRSKAAKRHSPKYDATCLQKHHVSAFDYLYKQSLLKQLVKQNVFHRGTAAETDMPSHSSAYQDAAAASIITIAAESIGPEIPFLLEANQSIIIYTESIPVLPEPYQAHSQLFGYDVDETYFPSLFKLYAIHSVRLKGIQSTAREFHVNVLKLTEWFNDEQICAALSLPNIILDIDRGEFPIIDIWVSTNFMEQKCLGHLPSYQEIKQKALFYARKYPEFEKFTGDRSWINAMMRRNGLLPVNGVSNFVKDDTLGMLFYLTMPTLNNPRAAPDQMTRRPLISILVSALASGYIFRPYIILTDKEMATDLDEVCPSNAAVVYFSAEETWDKVILDWMQKIWFERPGLSSLHQLLLDSCFMATLSPSVTAEFSRATTSIINGPVDVLVEYQVKAASYKAHLQGVMEQEHQRHENMARARGDVGELSSEWLFKILYHAFEKISFSPDRNEWIIDCFKDCRIAEYYWKE